MEASFKTELEERVVPFTAGDGFPCNLVHVRGETPPTKGPVLLVHGAGVRANIFRPSVETTFVEYLVANGYDVWLENWRASIDLPPNEWTLDQAALYDHPRAVEKVVQETGCEDVRAVIHCQGSTSFMMAAVAGLVPQVTTIVSNAVSLHPVVPTWSALKLKYAVPLFGLLTDYLNPQWDRDAPGITGKLLYAIASASHRECDNAVCNQVSFYYGAGFPALWSHENLNEETHSWLRDEFAHVPISFYRQMAASVRRGHLTPYDHPTKLPADLAVRPPETDARIAFFAGSDNRCFLPESQVRTHAHFEKHRPGYHSLHIVPGYGHLDMFIGQYAARDVFPQMLAALEA